MFTNYYVIGGVMEELTERQLNDKIHAFLKSRFEVYPDIAELEEKPTYNIFNHLHSFIKRALHKDIPQQA